MEFIENVFTFFTQVGLSLSTTTDSLGSLFVFDRTVLQSYTTVATTHFAPQRNPSETFRLDHYPFYHMVFERLPRAIALCVYIWCRSVCFRTRNYTAWKWCVYHCRFQLIWSLIKYTFGCCLIEYPPKSWEKNLRKNVVRSTSRARSLN